MDATSAPSRDGGSPSTSSSRLDLSSATTSALTVAGASLVAAGCAALVSHFRRRAHLKEFPSSFIPLIEYYPKSTNARRIERFGEYVVRQLRIPPEDASAALLAQAADDYVVGDKSKSDKSRDNLLALAAMACPHGKESSHEECVRTLASKLIAELDTCILAYFGFHWSNSSLLIQQVFRTPHEKLKLRDVVHRVMRIERQKKVVAELRTKQRISTLLEELRLLGRSGSSSSGSSASSPRSLASSRTSSLLSMGSTSNLLVPIEAPKRSPVLLLIGGGMGAGKSTVVKEILKRCFWSNVAYDAVVVEADAFKEKDVIFRALSADSAANMADVAQLVHEESTRAASSTLVTALNEGRDVIFDGTMSWAPFVKQTIQMARQVHQKRFRLGPGYCVGEDGAVEERYWEPVGSDCCGEGSEGEDGMGLWLDEERRPYRVEFVGVVCDPHLAVVRGMRRAILTKRGVPVEGQLRSHVLFAQAVEEYCRLVDQASIYSTNSVGGPAQLIGVKEPRSNLLVDPEFFPMLEEIKHINTTAKDVTELYRQPRGWLSLGWEREHAPGVTWHERVLELKRKERQEELRKAFTEIQVCLWPGSSADLPTSSTSFKRKTLSSQLLAESGG